MVVLGRFQYRISSSEHLYPDMHMKSDESNQKSWFLHVLFNLSHNIEVFFCKLSHHPETVFVFHPCFKADVTMSPM